MAQPLPESADTTATNLTTETRRARAEKQAASRVYLWLLLSPFVTVPCFASVLIGDYSGAGRVWAAIVPLMFHLPLVIGLVSKSLFVRRHTQQAVILIALRAAIAAMSLNISDTPEAGLWLFFFGGGALWLVGSVWGLWQVGRGECWLMRLRGERGELPRPWAVAAKAAAAPATGVPSIVPASAATGPAAAVPAQGPPLREPLLEVPADPSASYQQGQSLLNAGKRVEAVACFLSAFRNGPPDLRQQALGELEELGQVEAF